MKQFTRKEILDRLWGKINKKIPIMLGGAGIGLIGKISEEAKTDIIMAYSTGVFRMDGLISTSGLMPTMDCNDTTYDLGRRLFKVVKDTPIACGVGGDNPNEDIERLVDAVIEFGYSGIINVPMYGGEYGPLNAYSAGVGLGNPAEYDLITLCNRKEIFTIAYSYTFEELRKLVACGVDIISPHFGLTQGGTNGAETGVDIHEACEIMQKMYDMAVAENPNVIVVSHGGPFTTPEAVNMGFQKTDVHGFMGASSNERIPAEQGIYQAVKQFKTLRIR